MSDFDDLTDRLADALEELALELYCGDDTRDDVEVEVYDSETSVSVSMLLSMMAIQGGGGWTKRAN